MQRYAMEYIVGCCTAEAPGIIRIERRGDELVVTGEAPRCEYTTYLTFDRSGKYIYTGNELKRSDGGMSILCLDAQTLQTVDSCDASDNSPCHFALYGDMLFTSAYDAGHIAVYRAEDGRVSPLRVFDHNTQGRASHAHCALPDTKRHLVHTVDLGLDSIVTYSVGTDGNVSEFSRSAMPEHSGPRHMIWLDDETATVVCELSSELILVKWNGKTFTALDKVSTLPEGVTGSYAGAVKAYGGKIYVSNRGYDSIAVFEISNDKLVPCGHICARVDFPRDFTLCEDGALIIAGQRSDDIVLLVHENGTYTERCRLRLKAPVCVMSVPRVEE